MEKFYQYDYKDFSPVEPCVGDQIIYDVSGGGDEKVLEVIEVADDKTSIKAIDRIKKEVMDCIESSLILPLLKEEYKGLGLIHMIPRHISGVDPPSLENRDTDLETYTCITEKAKWDGRYKPKLGDIVRMDITDLYRKGEGFRQFFTLPCVEFNRCPRSDGTYPAGEEPRHEQQLTHSDRVVVKVVGIYYKERGTPACSSVCAPAYVFELCGTSFYKKYFGIRPTEMDGMDFDPDIYYTHRRIYDVPGSIDPTDNVITWFNYPHDPDVYAFDPIPTYYDIHGNQKVWRLQSIRPSLFSSNVRFEWIDVSQMFEFREYMVPGLTCLVRSNWQDHRQTYDVRYVIDTVEGKRLPPHEVIYIVSRVMDLRTGDRIYRAISMYDIEYVEGIKERATDWYERRDQYVSINEFRQLYPVLVRAYEAMTPQERDQYTIYNDPDSREVTEFGQNIFMPVFVGQANLTNPYCSYPKKWEAGSTIINGYGVNGKKQLWSAVDLVKYVTSNPYVVQVRQCINRSRKNRRKYPFVTYIHRGGQSEQRNFEYKKETPLRFAFDEVRFLSPDEIKSFKKDEVSLKRAADVDNNNHPKRLKYEPVEKLNNLIQQAMRNQNRKLVSKLMRRRNMMLRGPEEGWKKWKAANTIQLACRRGMAWRKAAALVIQAVYHKYKYRKFKKKVAEERKELLDLETPEFEQAFRRRLVLETHRYESYERTLDLHCIPLGVLHQRSEAMHTRFEWGNLESVIDRRQNRISVSVSQSIGTYTGVDDNWEENVELVSHHLENGFDLVSDSEVLSGDSMEYLTDEEMPELE